MEDDQENEAEEDSREDGDSEAEGGTEADSECDPEVEMDAERVAPRKGPGPGLALSACCQEDNSSPVPCGPAIGDPQGHQLSPQDRAFEEPRSKDSGASEVERLKLKSSRP